MPPRGRGRATAVAKDTRNVSRKEEVEPPRLTISPGAGWTVENYNVMKAAPKEKLTDNIYKIFGIPLLYKTSSEHPAIQIFVEFHLSAFAFAQQFVDTGKALMTLMILGDYLGNVPAFSDSKSSFGEWVQRTTKVIQNTEFTPAEQHIVMSYINNNLRANAHVLHFVITHEAMQRLDSEGLKLFHPVFAAKKEKTDVIDVKAPDPKAELEAQLAAAAAAAAGAAEEARRKQELQHQIETILNESMTKMRSAVDSRNEVLMQGLVEAQERLDGKPRRVGN
jgi:hypothetical protein